MLSPTRALCVESFYSRSASSYIGRKTYAETRLLNRHLLKIPSAATNLIDGTPDWTGSEPHGASGREFEIAAPFNHHEKRKKRRGSANLNGDTEHYDPSEITEVFEADVDFCSRSEAICAEMLRMFVPHFTLQEGVTFQVAIGRDAHGNTFAVDFLVDGVLFEYHPVRFFKNKRRCGDFNSKREYRAYTDICHSLGAEQREFFQSAMRARLADNYYHKRRALLDQHPVYRRMELVVATNPEEFYHLILKRFGKNVPRSVERFIAIFEELRESLPR